MASSSNMLSLWDPWLPRTFDRDFPNWPADWPKPILPDWPVGWMRPFENWPKDWPQDWLKPFSSDLAAWPKDWPRPLWEREPGRWPQSIIPTKLWTDLRHLNDWERQFFSNLQSDQCQVIDDPSRFAIQLDVRNYRPEEVEVKIHDAPGTVPYVSISAKHQDRSENSNESRFQGQMFQRRMTIPPDVDPRQIQCNWASNQNQLTIEAPRKALPPPPAPAPMSIDQGRPLPITYTGQNYQQNGRATPAPQITYTDYSSSPKPILKNNGYSYSTTTTQNNYNSTAQPYRAY